MQLARRTNSFQVIVTSLACAAGLWIVTSTPVTSQEAAPRTGPPTLLSEPLADVPGKNLVVVELNFAPNPAAPSTAEDHPRGHRPPASVYVYVTQGAVRLPIAQLSAP